MKAVWRRYQRSWGWILLVSLLLTAGLGVYLFQCQPDYFLSTAELYVLPKGADLYAQYDASVSELIARDCVELLKNKDLRYRAEAKLVPDTLEGMQISVTGIPGTRDRKSVV